MDNQRKGRIAVQTRYGDRHKKRRQNLILNSLIAVVFILIIVVGANLLKGPSNKNDVNVATTGDEHQQEVKQEEQLQDGIQSAGTEDEDEEDSHSDGDYKFSGGGPEGPWEPIGTKQTGEHVVQYQQDSLDWEEMEMALAYGAGIDRESMTVIWIGNGGSPQRAKGQVKDDHEQNKIYHVTIEWIDEQGWKPIQVEIEES